MRTWLAGLTLVSGLALALVSYFIFAAPLGTPTDESFSNPRVPFAATLFVAGVSLVVASAVVYELLPDRGRKGP
ncbi:MAG: hypothetical protein HY682_11460 [Chloroflexi bacterium]|nr:hypothetical protein [Chloroflexota bacterium]